MANQPTNSRFLGRIAGAAALCSGLVLAACSHQPGPYLKDARQAYEEARTGTAARFVPDRVYEARQALQDAERAFEKDPESLKVKHLAYVAERKAQLAAQYGDIEALSQARAQAVGAYATVLKQQREQLQQQYASAQQNAQSQQQVIDQERSARLAAQQEAMSANQEAAAALARLEQMASIDRDERGTVITIPGGVLFKTAESELLPQAEDRLREVAKALSQQKSKTPIVIEGHTDARGAEEYNEKLSQERAQSVRDFLVQNGVDSSLIQTRGRGENDPVASNDTVEGRTFNRRVEIVVQDGGALDRQGSQGATMQGQGGTAPSQQQGGQQQGGQDPLEGLEEPEQQSDF